MVPRLIGSLQALPLAWPWAFPLNAAAGGMFLAAAGLLTSAAFVSRSTAGIFHAVVGSAWGQTRPWTRVRGMVVQSIAPGTTVISGPEAPIRARLGAVVRRPIASEPYAVHCGRAPKERQKPG